MFFLFSLTDSRTTEGKTEIWRHDCKGYHSEWGTRQTHKNQEWKGSISCRQQKVQTVKKLLFTFCLWQNTQLIQKIVIIFQIPTHSEYSISILQIHIYALLVGQVSDIMVEGFIFTKLLICSYLTQFLNYQSPVWYEFLMLILLLCCRCDRTAVLFKALRNELHFVITELFPADEVCLSRPNVCFPSFSIHPHSQLYHPTWFIPALPHNYHG